MKVYVVVHDIGLNGAVVTGVFSEAETAEANRVRTEKWLGSDTGYSGSSVDEFELDEVP